MHARSLTLSVASLLAGAACLTAAESDVKVVLTGIVHFNGRSRALVELSGPGTRGNSTKPILSAGERIGNVEVREINPQAGQIRIVNSGEESILTLDGKATTSPRTFHFKAADSAQLLEIYQELAGRTLVRASTLPAFKFSGKTENMAADDALRFLESALLGKGIALDQRGDKFVLAVRSGRLEPLAFIADPPLANAAPDAHAAEEVILPGQIRFQDADPIHALEIYQELTGRTVLRPHRLGGGRITVRSQTPQTRAEAIWMLGTALSLADISVVPQGEKFVFALPGGTNVVAPAIASDRAPSTASGREPLPAGALKFSPAESGHVLGIYANLTGRRVADTPIPAARFDLRSQTLLTVDEARFALDAVAALNQVRFVPVGDDQVTLTAVTPIRADTP